MKKKEERMTLKRLSALLLAVCMTVTFIPFLGDGAYAGTTDKEESKKGKTFLVGENGSETEVDIEDLGISKEKIINSLDLENLGVEPAPPQENDISDNPEGITDDMIVGPEDFEDQGVPESELSPDNTIEIPGLFDDEQTEDVQEITDNEGAATTGESSPENAEPVKTVPDAEDIISTSSFKSSPLKTTAEISTQAYEEQLPDKYFSFNSSTGIAKIQVAWTTNKLRFSVVRVDGSTAQSVYSQGCNVSINMKNYSTGYHNIYLEFQEYTGYGWVYAGRFYRKNVPTYVYDVPNYQGTFEVYSTYFTYWPYANMWTNTAHPLYMDYGGTRSGAMKANLISLFQQQAFTFSGLTPNTFYDTSIFYGEMVGGQLWKGPSVGTGTYRTGMPLLPKIKSINVKATKVRKRKYTTYWAGYFYLWKRTTYFYTYKVKVTVNLKSKPGAAGLWINGQYRPGNKKKYTATFGTYSSYKHPSKLKFGVVMASYMDPSYGGYSPLYSKKKKLS